MIPPIQSLAQLKTKAATDSKYRDLLFLAAQTYKPTAHIGSIADAVEIIQGELDIADDPDDVTYEINGLRSQIR